MEARVAAAVANLAIINPRSPTSHHTHQFHKPMTLKMSTTTYKDSIDSDIDARLKQVITIKPPFEVFKPMHHLVFSTPKNIAPALCVAACEAVGGQRSVAIPAAAALHLMHVAASAHENLLLGNDDPKSKYSFGPHIELLTGDGIVPLGLELLAMSGQNGHESSDVDGVDASYTSRIVRVIAEITRAIGSRGVIDAQYKKYASVCSEHSDISPHVKRLRLKELKAKKGEFYGCGGACGAILGGGSEEDIERLRRCGIFVGMMTEESLNWDGNGMVEDVENVMKELRDLAVKELEGLDGGRIEFISSLVDSVFGDDKYQVGSGRAL